MTALVLPHLTRSGDMVRVADDGRLFVAQKWMAAATSLNGHVGLFVPAGSKIRAVVLAMRVMASSVSLVTGLIARGADRELWAGTVNLTSASAKVDGSSISPVALIRFDNLSTNDSGDYPPVFGVSAPTAGVCDFSEPLIVYPGQGIWVSSSLANTSFGFSVLWREEKA